MKQEKQKPTTRNVLKKFGVGAMLTATMFCTGGLLSGCMADGKDGKDGTNAAAWYYGTYTPTLDNRPGQVGDYYIDQDDNKIYQLTNQGWKEVANFGSGTQGPAGQPGADGEDGVTPHIGANGNWYIGTQDTGIKAQGQNGADGQPGEDGQDGVTPHIGANGNWWIGTQDTGVKAQGKDGTNGTDGTNGQDGKDGASVLSGILPPTETDGKNGDLYLNTNTYNLYKKQSGVWTLVGNIKGQDATTEAEYYTNLFDANAEGVLKNKYYRGNMGEIAEASGYMITDLIPVEAHKTYLYNIPYANSMGGSYAGVNCFDEKGNWLSYVTATTFDDGGTPAEYTESGAIKDYDALNDDILKLEITDSSVKFIKLSMRKSSANKVMFVQNETFPERYYPYGEPIYIDTKVVLTRDEYDLLMSSQNPLYKKRIAFEGDSICAGAGNSGVSYANMIAEANNMTLTKTAVGGGTITDGIYSTSGALKHSIVQGVLNLVANKDEYDYILFEGGVNDTSLDIRRKTEGGDRADNTYVNFGEVSTSYTADLDVTTFCGAFETCCKTLANSGKKVGYIFVHKIFSDSHYWVTEYRPAMIKILNKWGIPYLDLESTTPPLNMVQNLKDTYTGNADGWHPNELGYKTFYNDQITQWLKTL